jgi:hypothetical protein
MAGVTKVTLPAASMFVTTPVYEADGDVIFGLMRPAIQQSSSDRVITVTQADENRLDRIAFKALQDSRYWWAIALLSDVVDPLTEITTGKLLRVPPVSALQE